MAQSRYLVQIVCATLAAFVLPCALYMLISFQAPLEQLEKRLLVAPPKLLIPAVRTWQGSEVSCPVQPEKVVVAPQKKNASVARIIESLQSPPKPTLIFQAANQKKTVIHGVVACEGTVVAGWYVLKIEQGRVLLQRGKEKQWVSIN